MAMLALLLIRSLFLISVILLAGWVPLVALVIYLLKAAVNWIFVRRVGMHIGQRVPVKHFLYFEVYYFLMSMGGLLSHIIKPVTNWKGRTYR
jgi:hypothetical protein